MTHHYVRYIELSKKHHLMAQIVESDYINGETIRMDVAIRMQPK